MDAKQEALQALNDYKLAKKEGNASKENAASDRFNDIILDVEEPDRTKLTTSYNKMVLASLHEAVAEFSRISKEIEGASDAFELGAKMANEGKNELFFPFVAGELSQIATTVTKLAELAQEVIDQVDDLPDTIEAGNVATMIDEGVEAKQAVEALIAKLGEIRTSLDG